MHSRNLMEMNALHAQLKRIAAQKYGDINFDVRPIDKVPPVAGLALRRAITSGWADQVQDLLFIRCLIEALKFEIQRQAAQASHCTLNLLSKNHQSSAL